MTRGFKQGFTIVEMLMVIGVLAILMGIVTTASSAAIRQARERRTGALKGVIQAGVATYRSQQDEWPGTLKDFSEGKGLDDNRIVFLSATQYDTVMDELAKVSVGQANSSPVMDVMGIYVAQKKKTEREDVRGMEFREAIKKNKKHGSTYSLKEMAFGYLTKEKGYFRRFIVQYNSDSDNVTVMTQNDFDNWWKTTNSGDIQWPSGYERFRER